MHRYIFSIPIFTTINSANTYTQTMSRPLLYNTRSHNTTITVISQIRDSSFDYILFMTHNCYHHHIIAKICISIIHSLTPINNTPISYEPTHHTHTFRWINRYISTSCTSSNIQTTIPSSHISPLPFSCKPPLKV